MMRTRTIQEDSMKTRMTLVALMTVGLIGSAVGTGHAGGGGQGGPSGIQLLQCYGVAQGASQPHVLSIDDQFTSATEERVGKLKLVCAPTDWSVVNTGVVGEPNPVGQEEGDHLTCYEVSQAQATPSVVTLTDAFGEQTVRVQGPSRFVCVLAVKVCESGCPVITPSP